MTNRTKGLLFAILGPLLWGINSVVVDMLFAQGVNARWFAPFRLIVAGAVLLVWAYLKQGNQIFAPFKRWRDAGHLKSSYRSPML